jgi:glycosidase
MKSNTLAFRTHFALFRFFFSALLLVLTHSLIAQVSITFQVNLNYQIELGKFNKDTEWVGVAGTFNDWNGSDKFQDDNKDGIYELKIDGFNPGDKIAYKFRFNGQWDGREEFPGLGNDRHHTVSQQSDTLFHWYNNEVDPNAALMADFNANLRVFYEQGQIQFSDRSAGQIDRWEWTFEGGNPQSSNLQNPSVRYEKAGKYPVKLTVYKGDQSHTINIADYIHVQPRNKSNIPWWNETVFYEIFVRSFKDSDGDGIGDFKGLTEQLDYLNDGDPNTTDDLGIGGIWLMPIHEAGSYHGYDVIDYQSISKDYGSLDDFKTFLAEAHKRGIRVIIDFVINHNSSQSDWFKNAQTGPNATYRNFYRWSDHRPAYNGPWGQQVWHQKNGDYYYGLFWDGMPDLNYQEPKVKEAIFKAADFWLEEIGIDGFRLDAVKFIIEEGQQLEDTQSTLSFWKEFNQHVKSVQPNAFSVGEAWTNTEKVVDYVANNRLDYCFEFDLAGNILHSVNVGQTDNLYRQLQKMYNLYPHLQYGTFLANHDQNRIMNTLNFEESKVKLAAAIYLTLPGIPYIYYGEEIGMQGTKPDEFIRRPMQWNDGHQAGFTTGNPWISIPSDFATHNVSDEQNAPNSLLNNYKKFIHLRNNKKALQLGDFEAVISNHSKVFAYLRQYENQSLLVIHNTGTSSIQHLELTFQGNSHPLNDWVLKNQLDQESPILVNILNNKLDLTFHLEGRKTKVYQFEKTVSNQNLELSNSISLYPNPVVNQLIINKHLTELEANHYFIYDLQGKIIQKGKLTFSGNQTTISTFGLAPGFYHINIYGRQQSHRASFIKMD